IQPYLRSVLLELIRAQRGLVMKQYCYVFPVFTLFTRGLSRFGRFKGVLVLIQREVSDHQPEPVTILLEYVFDDWLGISAARALVIRELDYGHGGISSAP